MIIEYEPGRHAIHVLKVFEPVVIEYRPAGHKVGVLMPKLGQYVPAGQSLQAALPD
jgi:hypothetical protein